MTTSEQVLVPVARDGSIFAPSLRRRDGFQVGRKGYEVWVDDYREALRQACRLGYFRRPSATSGVFGIVKSVGFVWVELRA